MKLKSLFVFCMYQLLFYSVGVYAYTAQPHFINNSSTKIAVIDDFAFETGGLTSPLYDGKAYIDVAYIKDDKIIENVGKPILLTTEVDRLNQILDATYDVNGCPVEFHVSTLQMKAEESIVDEKRDECLLFYMGNKYTIHLNIKKDDYKWLDQIKVEPDQQGVLVDDATGKIVINNNLVASTLKLVRPSLANPDNEEEAVADAVYSYEVTSELVSINTAAEDGLQIHFNALLAKPLDFVVTVIAEYYNEDQQYWIKATTQKVIHYQPETYVLSNN